MEESLSHGHAKHAAPANSMFLTLKEKAVRFDAAATQRPTDVGGLWGEEKVRTADHLPMLWIKPSLKPVPQLYYMSP